MANFFALFCVRDRRYLAITGTFRTRALIIDIFTILGVSSSRIQSSSGTTWGRCRSGGGSCCGCRCCCRCRAGRSSHTLLSARCGRRGGGGGSGGARLSTRQRVRSTTRSRIYIIIIAIIFVIFIRIIGITWTTATTFDGGEGIS